VEIFLQSLDAVLKQRNPNIWVTKLLIFINVAVFIAMLVGGAGMWHSTNGIQLNWGANFGPATQDGEWWRLATAMFLHFGIVHLLLNTWSLWDAGQLVERMYGQTRFLSIYLVSGLTGNLVSLVFQGNSAVSGGASGAIFGIFGALLTFLWHERTAITVREFRWLFWGALGFAIATIVMGFVVPGIDNSAHIGGFVAGILVSIVFSNPITLQVWPIQIPVVAASVLLSSVVVLMLNIPPPKYIWSDEILLRKQISEFLYQDQTINRSWLEVIHAGKQGDTTLDDLASKIESNISEPYAQSFEKLSQLPKNPALPSSSQLDGILDYIQLRADESKIMAEKLRDRK
jgi:rhomboid protease GluP